MTRKSIFALLFLLTSISFAGPPPKAPPLKERLDRAMKKKKAAVSLSFAATTIPDAARRLMDTVGKRTYTPVQIVAICEKVEAAIKTENPNGVDFVVVIRHGPTGLEPQVTIRIRAIPKVKPTPKTVKLINYFPVLIAGPTR